MHGIAMQRCAQTCKKCSIAAVQPDANTGGVFFTEDWNCFAD